MNNDTILCPVDFSACSEVALEVAGRLAEPKKSKVILLNVADAKSEPTSLADAFTKNARSRLENRLLADEALTVEHLNLKGNPAEVILHIAKAKKADMIVMGTHGRSGWSKLMMGSVAQEVMKEAHCPVITVRMPQGHEAN
ncbi:MAG: universal stress protein [Pirellula sp.]|jgi:nucleotide-binding universal stress UspA family protein